MKTLLTCIALISTAVQSQIIEIPNGKLLGTFNGEYYSFFDVPYGAPPTGINRFEPPKPYNLRWSGLRNSTVQNITCIRFSITDNASIGDEDCLTLSIFTPDISGQRKYPVQVYIHGGAYMIGSGSGAIEYYSARRQMVLVTMNYRVGPFGFLSSGTDLISGNFGQKDQQLAMKWVYENIAVFGGDSGKILLSGFSAGGSSVQLHMLNPISSQYFNAAWSKSGVISNPWTMQPNPTEQFDKLVNAVGCQSENPKNVKICLQTRSRDAIFNAVNSMKVFRNNPVNLFGITVEASNVPNAFLTEDPLTLIKRGQIANIPWIVSYTLREGAYTAAEFMSYDNNGQELIGILNSRWREIAPVVLFYNNTCVGCTEQQKTDYRNMYSDYLKRNYMQGYGFSVATYPLLEQIFTDVMFVNGALEAVSLHRKYGTAPVYTYAYGNSLKYANGNVLSNRTDLNFGADHGADQSLVIPLRYLYRPNDTFTDNDRFIAENLIEMGKELSISGLAKYDSKLIPANTPTQTGKLTIYETYYVIESVINGEYSIQTYNNPPYKAGYFYGVGN